MKRKFVVSVLIVFWMMNSIAQNKWKIESSVDIVSNPSFRQCHASTIVEVSKSKLLGAWFAGSREGSSDVCIWLAEYADQKWSQPKIVASGIINDTLRYPAWNPVLFKSQAGKLFLFYKVGPSPQTWWGMVMSSADLGKTWSVPKRLPDDILGPIKNKPFQLNDGSILSGSSTETSKKWSAHIERSTDGGETWTKIPVDTAGAFDVIQPSIVPYEDGRLQILCRSKQGAVVQAWSDDNGKSWGKLSKTNLINPNSGTDAVTIPGHKQVIVYNPDLPGKDWFNGRGKLRVAISSDGNNWKDIAVLENGDKEEYSYPAIIRTSDGKLHITYTNDRKNIRHVVLTSKR